jgi:DNA-binding NarL/FixJ family response regulator
MEESKHINVVLIDDNVSFRQALKLFVKTEFNANIVAEYNDIFAFCLSQDCTDIDVIILNIKITDMEKYKNYMLTLHKSKIIAIIPYNEKLYVKTLKETGFIECVFIDNIFTELLSLIPNNAFKITDNG